ncbi:MAG: hypothetical protein D3907_03795 [Candidatus Electrothrix sp. AUS3]|nr:hypothetical protein [Candidatus Electrothrix gigas]
MDGAGVRESRFGNAVSKANTPNMDWEFLVWQEKLRVLLGQWEESGQDEGALLRGLPLDEALRWRETHDVHLAEEEREFIEASKSTRRKQQRKKGIGIAFGVLLAAAVMVTFFVLWKDAEQQKVVAEQERQHAVEQSKIAEQKTAEVKIEKEKVKQQAFEAKYNLSKAVEGKALRALNRAKEENNVHTYQEAVLFTSAALYHQLDMGTFFELSSADKLFRGLENNNHPK